MEPADSCHRRETEASGGVGWFPAAGGFIWERCSFFYWIGLCRIFHPEAHKTEGVPVPWRRTTLLVSAVTLHNIPEGMAVGLSFALAAQHNEPDITPPLFALALGIGIQNFPEGRRDFSAASAGGGPRLAQLYLRKSFRRGRTHFRRAGGAGGGRDSAADAMAAPALP